METENETQYRDCLEVVWIIALSITTSAIASAALFGNPVLILGGPIHVFLFASLPVRQIVFLFFFVGLFATIWFTNAAAKRGARALMLVPLFLPLWLLITSCGIALSLDVRKAQLISAMEPDAVYARSAFLSLRHVGKYRRPPHAIVVKNCVIYNLSYNDMAFYKLPPGVFVRQTPKLWYEQCRKKTGKIRRIDSLASSHTQSTPLPAPRSVW